MRYDLLIDCINFGFRDRQYTIRCPENTKMNLNEMTEEDIVFTRQDIPNWNEQKCLVVLIDDKEDITLQILRNVQLELNNKEGLKLLRQLRNQLISDTDYLLMIDYPISVEKMEEWKVYRQALRDLPSISNPTLDERGNLDMNSFVLPEKPN